MANKKVSQLTETINLTNEDYMMIVQSGRNKKVKVGLLKGADNLSSDYLELVGDDGENYRLKIKNGKPYVYPSAVDTATPPSEGQNLLYDGLIINRMYGGGQALVNTAVSHGFIELYNCRTNAVNLKGLYLWYKTLNGSWQKLALEGIVPPYHSFLIRGAEHNDYHKDFVRCHIDNYDMQWDMKFSDKGFSVYLCIGDAEPESNPQRNTVDALGNINWTNPRYIDLLGCGGKGKDENVSAYEVRWLNCMDVNTGVMREDFANSGKVNIGSNKHVKGNNEADCLPIDYSKCDVSIYKPKCLADGEWTVYFDKLKLKETCPNLVNICYGENGNNTRTFTWQSKVTDEGYLKYRKQGTESWTKVETTRQLVRHKDGDATIHSVVIKGLSVGVYEYQAGEEGAWSDIETFEIKMYNSTTPIRFLITSDEQGWTTNEYKVVETAAKFIESNENYDFHLNLGDISQNANRSFEWRSYFKFYKGNKNIPHMITCGNNDLVEKKYSDAFAWYTTFENQKWNSVHSWDLGFTHFVCLNSNTDYTYVTGQGSIGGFSTTDEFLQAQCDWLDEHLTEVSRRATKPKWVIIYMHIAPFTVGRTKRIQRFVSIFEKHKVDLVLCGHNHAYSRSKALYTGYDFNSSAAFNDYITKVSPESPELKIVDEFKADGQTPINREEDKANGTYYVLAQASGFKLEGKEKPITLPDNLQGTIHDNGKKQPWWIVEQGLPSQPCYIMVNISESAINLEMYYIQNVLETDVNGNIKVHDYDSSRQSRYKFDELTINYSDRNKS